MIQVTQEMRNEWYAEMRFDLLILESTIERVVDTEFARAGDNPVAMARAKERQLATSFIVPLITAIAKIEGLFGEKNQEALFSAIDDLTRLIVDIRSADRGCSIMERYHRENDKNPRLAELLIKAAGTGFDAKNNQRAKKTKQ